MHVHCTDESRRICEETASVLRSQGQSAEAVAVTFYDNLRSEIAYTTDVLFTDDAYCVLVL